MKTLLEHDLVDRLHLLLCPLTLGGTLTKATPYPTGVVGLDHVRAAG